MNPHTLVVIYMIEHQCHYLHGAIVMAHYIAITYIANVCKNYKIFIFL